MAWTPEIAVDRKLARRLIGSQFPELELHALEQIGEGWDNTVWLVDGEWAFRFPRRAIAVPLVQRELAILPAIAPQLPIAVPEPVFHGAPSDAYPWPYLGARFIPGEELRGGQVDEGRLARELGAFLRALHAIEPPAELPHDPNGRSDMTRRAPLAQQHLESVQQLGLWNVPDRAWALLDEARLLAPPERTVLAHGDLHFRHALIDSGGVLAGVIDWGDICAATPGVDLLLYWSAFTPTRRKGFVDAYGPAADDDLVRARVIALSVNAILAEYGHREGRMSVRDEALASLARTVAD